jgi:AraC-like DNA-binding protein
MQATFHIKRERIRQFHIEHYQRLEGPLHFHSLIELLLVEEGRAEVWIGDEHLTLCGGQMAVVTGYRPHHFYAEAGTVRCTDLFIPTHLCPEFTERVGNQSVRAPVIADAGAITRISHAIGELEREETNSLEQIGYIHLILGTVLHHLNLQSTPPPAQDDSLPAKLLLYIHEHYGEDISTASLAQALGYSQNHLSKSFRACFHIGISRYISTVRLRRAVELMQERKSITECALESGFSSLRTFYRAFEAEFGCPPREYLRVK